MRQEAAERCYHCGWQALGCLQFDPNDARRQAWNGKWPGEKDCERLDFFVNGDPDFPDLNRLFTDCVSLGHAGRPDSSIRNTMQDFNLPSF